MYLFIYFFERVAGFFWFILFKAQTQQFSFSYVWAWEYQIRKGKKKEGGGGEIERKIDGTDSVLTLTVLN